MASLKRGRRLPALQGKCSKCEIRLGVGTDYFSHLTEEQGEWKRFDYCSACFLPSSALISWKGKIKKREALVLSKGDEALIEELFETEESLWSAFLLEVLLRKGLLKKRASKFYEVILTGELIEIERAPLPSHELPALKDRFERITRL